LCRGWASSHDGQLVKRGRALSAQRARASGGHRHACAVSGARHRRRRSRPPQRGLNAGAAEPTLHMQPVESAQPAGRPGFGELQGAGYVGIESGARVGPSLEPKHSSTVWGRRPEPRDRYTRAGVASASERTAVAPNSQERATRQEARPQHACTPGGTHPAPRGIPCWRRGRDDPKR
jgi:hypothetical protein